MDHIAIYPLENGYIVCKDQTQSLNTGVFVRKVGGIAKAIKKLYGAKNEKGKVSKSPA